MRGPVRGVWLAIGLVLVVTACSPSTGEPTLEVTGTGYRGTRLGSPYAMPDVTLTDTAGRDYNLVRSPSRPVTLLFFGYTHCPDVCTGVLSALALTLQGMSDADRDQVQVVFVTTDPARDTPAAIRSYLDRLDPTFVGLTGSASEIRRSAETVGVDIAGHRKQPDGGYHVGHSDQVTGFRRGHGEVLWTPGIPIGDLRHDVVLLVERSR